MKQREEENWSTGGSVGVARSTLNTMHRKRNEDRQSGPSNLVMSIERIPKQEVDPSRWNALVDSAPQAWLFHRYEFQSALATWPIYRESGFALVDDSDGTILALVPCHRRGSDVLESFGGPVFNPTLGPNQLAKVAQSAHAELYSLARSQGAQCVEVRLPQVAPALRGDVCPRVNPLLEHGYANTLSQTYLVDLRRTEEDLWARLLPNCRTHIRKAEKEGCTLRIARADSVDLDIYYHLHCETYRRTGVTPHPFDYFAAIWRDFVSAGLAVVFFVERDGEVIAADNEACYKKAMSGWTAAGSTDASRIGANNLLHWTAMQWAKSRGADWYESGEAFPGSKSGKQKGLNDFKKSFGGELYPIYQGKISVAQPESGPDVRRPPGPGSVAHRVKRFLRQLSGR